MKCPKCGGSRLTPNDTNGKRFKCLDCGGMLNLSPQKRGPKPIGDRPMTATERKRRSRAIKRLLED